MSVLINITINLVFLFFMYHYLKWNILKKGDSNNNVNNFDDEAEKLVIEINRTTERNLQLIEAKIGQLKDLLKDADRVVSVIKREKSGSLDENELYRKLENRSFYENAVKPENDIIKVELPGKKLLKNISASKNTDNKNITETIPESTDTRGRVITMYRNGIDLDLISRNLNIPTGEIELIISLDKAGRE